MDLARAIHKLDPNARFLLNHSQDDGLQVIVDWRSPGPVPTVTMLRDAWDLCLDDDLSELAMERERQEAILRVKGNPTMVDLVTVLRL